MVATFYIHLKMQQIMRSAFRVRSLSLYAMREMLIFKSLPLPVGSMCNDTSLCYYTMHSGLQHILQNSELLSSSATGGSCVRLNGIFLSSSRVLETHTSYTNTLHKMRKFTGEKSSPVHSKEYLKILKSFLFYIHRA